LTEARKFTLFVDQIPVIENLASFLKALLLLFASFYIFNIEYPEKAEASLEFIQR